ncbi:MAG: cobyrinate a,c-diamide synthase [Nitrospirae bacterium]|nr:cobyrinate a,c-diamide synthase [Nitrospirota bacterium]
MSNHGFVVAAVNSGAGKTTVSLGLMASFISTGKVVQPYKVGPDFIDPGLHTLLTGRPSRNLDPWMCGRDYTIETFHRGMQDAHIAVVEGVMGVLDGGISSTASVARLLKLPVVLVLDVTSMAETAVLPVKGLMEIDKGLRIAGVILNKVASRRHFSLVKEAIEKHCRVPVFGYLPREKTIEMPQRHLGLYTAEDGWLTRKFIQRLTEEFSRQIDLKALLKHTEIEVKRIDNTVTPTDRVCRIGIARDSAFCFYYPDNLEMLTINGAECIYFSPIKDKRPPEVDALYIGGGYPELYARELSNNQEMIASIRDFINRGSPVYAECGGFMYLTEGIYLDTNEFYPMVGVYPFRTRLLTRRASLGYREIRLKQASLFGPEGTTLRGHEFHYSKIDETNSEEPLNIYEGAKGYRIKNTLASYVHLHFASNPSAIRNFINFIKAHIKSA